MASSNHVNRLYKTVVEDVTNNVRESFLDEGVDEQVLQELKSLWEAKLHQSKALASAATEDVPVGMYPRQQVRLQQQQQHQPIQIQTQQLPVQGTQQQTVTLPIFTQIGEGVDLSGAATAATMALPPQLYQQQLGALGGGITLQQTSQGHIIAIQQGATIQAMAPQQIQLPVTTQAFTIPQQLQQISTQQVAQNRQQQQQGQGGSIIQQPGQGGSIIQLDGANDSSSDDEDYDNDDDDNEDGGEDENEAEGEEEEPLCSDDDVDEEDPLELFDTENVVVCQYDKINRAKNRWKFHLKDGIMNLDGRDYVFQKANGDAEW